MSLSDQKAKEIIRQMLSKRKGDHALDRLVDFALYASIYAIFPAVLQFFEEDLLGALAIDGGTFLGLFLLASAVDKLKSNDTGESTLKGLLEAVQTEDLIVRAFDRDEQFPFPLLFHTDLIDTVPDHYSRDYMSVTYRNVDISCSNIVLLCPETLTGDLHAGEVLDDEAVSLYASYREDVNLATQEAHYKGKKEIVFYGSVLVFTPGPEIEGSVSAEVKNNSDYFKKLQEYGVPDFQVQVDPEAFRSRFFHMHHYLHGLNEEDHPQTDQVFTPRVTEMILEIERRFQAPVEVYADRNMVCISILDRIFDFDFLSQEGLREDEILDSFKASIHSFTSLLDVIIGPRGDEFTELFRQRTGTQPSVFRPFLMPGSISLNMSEITAYLDALFEMTTDIQAMLFEHVYSHDPTAMKELSTIILQTFLSGLFSTDADQSTSIPDAGALSRDDTEAAMRDLETAIRVVLHVSELKEAVLQMVSPEKKNEGKNDGKKASGSDSPDSSYILVKPNLSRLFGNTDLYSCSNDINSSEKLISSMSEVLSREIKRIWCTTPGWQVTDRFKDETEYDVVTVSIEPHVRSLLFSGTDGIDVFRDMVQYMDSLCGGRQKLCSMITHKENHAEYLEMFTQTLEKLGESQEQHSDQPGPILLRMTKLENRLYGFTAKDIKDLVSELLRISVSDMEEW